MPGARVHSYFHSGDFAPKRPISSVLLGVEGSRKAGEGGRFVLVFVRSNGGRCFSNVSFCGRLSAFLILLLQRQLFFLLATATTIMKVGERVRPTHLLDLSGTQSLVSPTGRFHLVSLGCRCVVVEGCSGAALSCRFLLLQISDGLGKPGASNP